jgi:UDP-3-O-[3-hydroxymyristoyl] glucosamine N-acyltransferase
MNARRFFEPANTFSVRDVVAITGAEPSDGADLDHRINDVAQLERAGPHDLTFLSGRDYADLLQRSRSKVCLLEERFRHLAPAGMTVLRVKNPYAAFAAVAHKLYPQALRPTSLFETAGAAPGALVDPSARIEADVTIDPRVSVGPRAAIGAGTVVGATARIGADVRIGRDCFIGPGAVIVNALIGDRVIVHPGVCIGQPGRRLASGLGGQGSLPGRVIIQDDVEIGANTTIDRGSPGDTVIGQGTKIDNLAQIGHNVTIGRNCLVVAKCGLAGGSILADDVVLGGAVVVAEALRIGERAMVGASASVTTDIPPGQSWLGVPALPSSESFRVMMLLKRRGGDAMKQASTNTGGRGGR